MYTYSVETAKAIREKLLTDVIRRFGFENCRTISFAMRCEQLPFDNRSDTRLIHFHDALLALPLDEEEDF